MGLHRFCSFCKCSVHWFCGLLEGVRAHVGAYRSAGCARTAGQSGLLGGSWIVININEVINRVTIVIRHIRGL